MMLTDIQREVVLTLAEHNLNKSKTAKAMYLHRNTVVYHIDSIKRITGFDPTTFSGMEKLLWRLGDEKIKRELLPCPFCGGDVVMEVKDATQRSGGFNGFVRCTCCPIGIVTPRTKTKIEAEECALSIWNRRVKQTKIKVDGDE